MRHTHCLLIQKSSTQPVSLLNFVATEFAQQSLLGPTIPEVLKSRWVSAVDLKLSFKRNLECLDQLKHRG